MKDITTLDTQKLKALAYDILAEIELHQRNLRAINAEIYQRSLNKTPPNEVIREAALEEEKG